MFLCLTQGRRSRAEVGYSRSNPLRSLWVKMKLPKSALRSLWARPEVRAITLLSLAFVGLLILLRLQTTAFGRGLLIAIFSLVLVSIVASVAVQTFKLGWSLRAPLLRAVVRSLRLTRKVLHIPDSVKFLYLVAWLAFICSTVLILLAKDAALYQIASAAGFSIFVLGASLDLLLRIAKLMRKAWAKTVGKILSALLGAGVAMSSLILAKHQVHAIARVDPKYFDDFVNIFALVLAPLLYVAIGIAALAAFACLQILVLIFFATARTVVGVLNFENVAPRWHQDCRVFWYRIRFGKRPQALPVRRFFPIEDIALFMRPLGTVAVASLLAALIDGTLKIYIVKVSDLTTKAFVAVQYRSDSRCEGLITGSRVAYLDRGNVSTARLENGRYVFDVASCKLPLKP